MRKKICGSCGKFFNEGTRCECRKAANTEARRNYERDPMIGSYRWKKKREFIRRRDNNMCQRCLIKYKLITTTDLSVHHIKSRNHYPELAWDDDNLICVCGSCNSALGTSDKLDFEWNTKQNSFNL
ncbi:MAG TPA: HNH endonuclease [Lachnospiraceae bacterium]|nr:HNH endonuclease [uncultured Lachnoclostridium sp.]HAU85073.1 HNH endonuclease [Lachnospiraceae bacterium]